MIGINVCLAAFLAVLAIAIAEDVYPNLFNDVDADEILANTELRQQYYNCVMETSPCMTEEQKFFKEHAAEVLATKCKKCTENQKKVFEKIVIWYTTNAKEEWEAAVKKLLSDAKKMNAGSS